MKQILLSGMMTRFAGCGSAWKKSSSCTSRFMITYKLACQRLRLDALMRRTLARNSWSLLSTAAMSSHIQTPETNSLTITSSVQYWK